MGRGQGGNAAQVSETRSLTGMREIPIETVQRTAQRMGDHSSAAAALRDAKSHPGPVKFWGAPGRMVVEKLPAE
jgi:hypothetical protein